MTNLTLLDRLRQADLETWNELERLRKMFSNVSYRSGIHYTEQICSDSNKFLRERLLEAWIQHALQEAIRIRKWHLLQSQDPSTRMYYAEISKIAPGYAGDRYTEHCLWLIGSGKDNSSENALLKAYLVAIES